MTRVTMIGTALLLVASVGPAGATLVEKWSTGELGAQAFCDIGQVDQDSQYELLFEANGAGNVPTLVLIDGKTGQIEWRYQDVPGAGMVWGGRAETNGSHGWACGPRLLDVDADGFAEVVVWANDGGQQRVRVFDATPTDVGVEGGPTAPTESLVGRPNPTGSGTSVAFALQTRGPVLLEVYDVNGRVVRRADCGIRDVGAQQLSWDGLDDSGRSVPSGSYFMRVLLGDEEVGTARATLLR